ncbi:hypothetical protein EW093_08905 [Thiospirochaeta perfilievii]|uniref:Organic solvent tolerance-like N-terminal domain-containing protein n=1 Tax=Thiospirochaeta perfilievii TaxID=252967 RepID=A0A5C1QBD6_9SPIO|nr:LptA/OstA family protein [Thiospirochaeta perfilievii]QEN04817.1 hypothetical protein EW093_08905 [Thiospirochaeta perfilievii]
MKRGLFYLFMLIYCISNINSSEALIFGCDQSESSFAEHNKRSTLIGNAYIKTDTLNINSDRIELYGEDYRFASCTGSVLIHNIKENFYINSEKLLYDNEKKEATVTGNAIMKDIDNEMIIKGEYIKSFEKTSITLIQIKVRIINEDLVCRSEFAEYNSEINRLVLTGDPVVFKGDDVFRASKITINLDTNDIIMEGKVKGNISEEKDED